MNTPTMNNTRKIARGAFGTLIIPVAVGLILWGICAANGVSMFSNAQSLTIFVRGVATVMLTTIALAINLNSGRFDFSLGSVATLSAVISAQITLNIGGNAFTMLILSIVFGTLLGALSGGIYVLLRLPPIITSLGVALLYEGLAFTITKGSNVSFYGKTDVSGITTNIFYMMIIIAVVLVVTIVLFDRSRFGFRYKALMAGQKVSVNTGIKEVSNAVICYAFSGALMSIVGYLTATSVGTISVDILNFGSIGIMFSAFLPMFIGGFIGRYSNDKLGYLLAAITMTFFSMAYSALNLKSSTQSIINAVLLVVFLIYLSNEKTVKDIAALRHIRNLFKKKTDGETNNA